MVIDFMYTNINLLMAKFRWPKILYSSIRYRKLNFLRPFLQTIWLVLIGCTFLLSGCATISRAPYTAYQANVAQIEGFENVRTFEGAAPGSLPNPGEWVTNTPGKDVRLLALSGGGSGGAFSIGVLSAWTQKGDRPQFDVVTGVSIGALIAPFAFLGSAYDDQLKNLYMSERTARFVDVDWRTAGIFGTSFLKGLALRQMVDEEITPAFLEKIAYEHRNGRRLFVVTTDLDTQRAVTWNMGAIADSGRPEAVNLFRDVLMASAAVPGVFPAVMIKARVGNSTIEEMHSDGGSSMQFFAVPEYALTVRSLHLPQAKRFHIYVIINNALIPEFDNVDNHTLSVMGRAYAVLIKSQTKQGLQALYNFAQRSKSELEIASIDQQVPYSMLNPFSETYMRTVYMLGYSRTLAGNVWKNRPIFE